jgi:hypothetical protein
MRAEEAISFLEGEVAFRARQGWPWTPARGPPGALTTPRKRSFRTGNCRRQHVLTPKQALELYQAKLSDCDVEIERALLGSAETGGTGPGGNRESLFEGPRDIACRAHSLVDNRRRRQLVSVAVDGPPIGAAMLTGWVRRRPGLLGPDP